MKALYVALGVDVIITVGVLGFALGAVVLGGYSPNMLRELVAGETPKAKISAYLEAVQAQDRGTALDAWVLPAESAENFASLSARRALITEELLALGITRFTVSDPQWWGTCCTPGVTHLARNAGGARVDVQVMDVQGNPHAYTFDVFTDGPYFGDAEGNPYRRWHLRDAYPREGGQPLFWQLIYESQVLTPESP